MSYGIIVTLFAWIAHKLACSISPTRKASLASCNAKTAELCSFRPSLHFCMTSLTNLWKGTLLMRRLAPFWYFWISFRACIPLCTFLFFSSFSSLIAVNFFLFLSLICWALFWFSSFSFSSLWILLSPASYPLSCIAFTFVTFIVLAISNNGSWFQFITYRFQYWLHTDRCITTIWALQQ